MTEPDDERTLEDLVAEVLDRVERDGPSAVDALCAEHPEHASRLRRRLGLLAEAGLLVDADGSGGASGDTGASSSPLPLGTGVEAGSRIGDYDLVEPIGEGAMGQVWRARDRRTGREVAVKIVRAELLGLGDARERFRREVELAARLEHPGLLSILAVGEQDGRPWFASELVRGIGLDALIAEIRERFGRVDRIDSRVFAEIVGGRGPDDESGGSSTRHHAAGWRALVLDLSIQLARALAAAHAGGVLHRDVKPSNALVRRDGSVVLADLGLAVEMGDSSLTRTGAVVGSLPYMAPEVLDGARGDARADVYSLGATLYELWTLERAYSGSTVGEITRRIAEGDHADPRRVAGLGADAAAVLERALAVDPKRRYPTADALASDLEALRDGLPTLARPLGVAGRAWRSVRRRPATALAVVLVAALAVGGPLAFGAVQAAERRATERSAERLTELNADLTVALDAERRERRRADENLARAMEAVEALVAETSDSLIGDVPHTKALHADLMRRALVIVDGLRRDGQAAQLPGEFVARVEYAAARALLELNLGAEAEAATLRGIEAMEGLDPAVREGLAGLEFSLLGRHAFSVRNRDPKRSLALYERALELDDRPGVLHVDRLEVRHEILSLERELGIATNAIAKSDALVADARRSLARFDEDDPERSTAREQLCRFLIDRGTQAYKYGDVETAIDQLAEGLELASNIADEEPRRLSLRSSAVVARTNLIAALFDAGRIEEAEEQIGIGMDEARRLSEAFPSSSNYASHYAGMVANAGLLESQRGERAEAERLWQRAIEIATPYLDSPEVPTPLVRHVAQSTMNLASVVRDRGDHAHASDLARRALELFERLTELAPGDPLGRRGLVVPRVLLTMEALEGGRPDEAEALLDAAVASDPIDPETWRMLVEMDVALIEALVAGGDADADRVERLAARVCASYARAFELGWRNRRDWAENPRLEPLRGRADWPEFPADD